MAFISSNVIAVTVFPPFPRQGRFLLSSPPCRGILGAEGGEIMSCKGFRYEYKLTSHDILEYEAVNFAYTQAGWKDLGAPHGEGFPESIIFEWEKDGPPLYPAVNWPPL